MIKAVLLGKKSQGFGELLHFVSSHGHVEVSFSTRSLRKARTYILSHNPDIFFLEIDLFDCRGIDLLMELDVNTNIVIISKNYDYAALAFEIDVLDYIVKPITKRRLHVALERALNIFTTRIPVGLSKKKGGRNQQQIVVKTSFQQHFIKVNEILAITSCGGNYTTLHLRAEDITYIRKPLIYWESQLPSQFFNRIHRLTIINMHHIDRIEKVRSGPYRVWLRHQEKSYVVSRRQQASFKQRIDQW